MAAETSDDLREIPGSYGLPLVGLASQSIAFFKNLVGFCTERRDRYQSTVFKASPGISSIVLLEQDSLETIFDTSLVDKPYGFGPLRPIPVRVGHIRPTICSNGEAHDRQKGFVLGFIARRVERLAPTLNTIADPYLERWAKEGKFDWGTEIDRLMADFVFQYAIGAKLDAQDVSEWAYASLGVGPLWLPRPGTRKAVAQLNRMLEGIRASPDYDELVAKGAEEGGMDADETAKQMLFTLAFNSWGGLQGVARSIIAELFLNPDWADRAAAEVRKAMPEGTEPTLELIDRMPIVGRVVRETMRLHTPVPTIYGIAKQDLVVRSTTGSYPVKKGELMQGVLTWANQNPEVFDRPGVFDPQRFESEEANRNLVWAAGRDVTQPTSTNHMCAGRNVVYQALTLFVAKLLRYRWTLSVTPDWGTGFSAASRPITPVECTSFTSRDLSD